MGGNNTPTRSRGWGKPNPESGGRKLLLHKNRPLAICPPRCRNRLAAARRGTALSPNTESVRLCCAPGLRETGAAALPGWKSHTPRVQRLLGRPLRGGFAVELCRTGVGPRARPPGNHCRNDERGTMNNESSKCLIHYSSFRVHRLLTAQSPDCPVPLCGCECSRPAAARRFCRRRSGRFPASGPSGRSPRPWPPRTHR